MSIISPPDPTRNHRDAHPPVFADWLRPVDGGRAVSAAAVREVIRGQERTIATLLWWLHRSVRPRRAEEYGLDLAGETALHRRLVAALLPPGTPIHRDELVHRIYGAHLAEGFAAGAVLKLLRTEMSRLRIVVAERGWSIPAASTASEFVLLRPGQPLPAGYVGRAHARWAPRTVTPALAREAFGHLERGESEARILAACAITRNVLGELRRGRHWTQREGLVPGVGRGVRR